MFENINETGKVFGRQIFQPKAVRDAYSEWEKGHQSRFWKILNFTFILILSFISVKLYTDSYPLLDLLVKMICVIFMYCGIQALILNRQYNKQAADGLKKR